MVKRIDEENPFLREIWALGFDKVIIDNARQKWLLIRHKDKFTSIIPKIGCNHGYTIKASILHDGTTHTWLAESDGSAQRFRDLIQTKGGNYE